MTYQSPNLIELVERVLPLQNILNILEIALTLLGRRSRTRSRRSSHSAQDSRHLVLPNLLLLVHLDALGRRGRGDRRPVSGLGRGRRRRGGLGDACGGSRGGSCGSRGHTGFGSVFGLCLGLGADTGLPLNPLDLEVPHKAVFLGGSDLLLLKRVLDLAEQARLFALVGLLLDGDDNGLGLLLVLAGGLGDVGGGCGAWLGGGGGRGGGTLEDLHGLVHDVEVAGLVFVVAEFKVSCVDLELVVEFARVKVVGLDLASVEFIIVVPDLEVTLVSVEG